MQILTEPKNALIKQYAKFFEYDGVDLQFTDGCPARHRGGGHQALDRGARPADDH